MMCDWFLWGAVLLNLLSALGYYGGRRAWEALIAEDACYVENLRAMGQQHEERTLE